MKGKKIKRRDLIPFISFLKREWWVLAAATLLLTGFSVVRTYSASYISEIVEYLQTGRPIGGVIELALIGAAVSCSSYVMRYAGSMLCVMLTEKLALQTRRRLVEHLEKIPWSEYERLKTGQLQAVIRSDVQQGADLIYSVFSRIELNVLLFLATFVYMLLISPAPAVLIAVFTLCMAFVNQRILTRQKLYRKRSRDAAGEVGETVLTACRGMSTVKAYRAQPFIFSLLGEKKRIYNDAVYQAERIDAGRLSAYNLTSNVVLYAAVLILGYEGLQGKVSWGDILVFIVLVRQVIMPAEVIFRWMGRVAVGLAAWERIGDVFAIPAEENGRGSVPEPEEEFALKAVSFSYGPDAQILDGQELSLRKGELTALIGGSGSGKTTLCKILCGLYGAQEEKIGGETGEKGYRLRMERIVDGKKDKSSGSVDWCVYNPAEPELFRMSVYENIVFGRTEVSRQDCMAAAEQLGAADFIRALPEGIDTVIEAGGRTLSGGQRQAVMNLRALLSGRKMLILDEAFASLDTNRRDRLTDCLKKQGREKFILLVAHQERVAGQCEKVIGIGKA